MAVPKRRMSKSRSRMRRAQHDHIALPTISVCPNCTAPIRPHHVCGACGQYKGREIIASVLPDEEVGGAEE